MWRVLLGVLLVFVLVTPSRADLESANAAYMRGDYKTALQEYNVLAEQGNAEAQYLLGLTCQTGDIVRQDYVEGAKWLRKAAEQGHGKAQYYLGWDYFTGQGVPQDSVLAYMWFSLASDQGVPVAQESRDMIATQMTPAEIAQAQEMARNWKPKLEATEKRLSVDFFLARY